MSTTHSSSFEKVCNSDLKGRIFAGTYTRIDEILQVKKVQLLLQRLSDQTALTMQKFIL